MADHVSSGQPLEIGADDWNNARAAGADYAQRRALGGGRDTRPSQHVSHVIAKVKNNTGADRARGDVLELGDYLLTDSDNHTPWFEGETPDTTRLSFAILQEPIKEDEIGKAYTAGVGFAVVNVTDAAHKFAYVKSGEHKLQSATGGNVRILHKPSGTGDKDCMVQIVQTFNGFVLGNWDATTFTNGGSSYGDIDFTGGDAINARGFELTDTFEFTALRDGTYLVNTSFFVYAVAADAENEYYLNFVLHRTRGGDEHEAVAGRFWMFATEVVTSVTDSGDTVVTDFIMSPWSGTASNTLIIDVKKDDAYKFKWSRSATNTDYTTEGWFTFTEIPPNSNDGLDEVNTDPWTLV